jgi:hypothetical protein
MRPATHRELPVRSEGAWLNAEEVSAMLSAYVLIETEAAKVAQVLSGLMVCSLAEDIAGPNDVIARVQAPFLDQPGRPVVSAPGR